jgi:uncharacterized protein (TIGR02246 family)
MANDLIEKDKEAIQSLLNKMRTAWANGNGSAYADCFTSDAHYVEAPGYRVIGNKVIGERHQNIFDTFFRHTTIDGNYPSEWRVINSDIVLIHSEGNVLFPGEKGKHIEPNGYITMCLVRVADVWRITSFQNTPFGSYRTFKFFWRFLKSRFYLFVNK